MREIKFRAWDGEKFYSPILENGCIFRNGRAYEDGIDYTDQVMQYTGLKDKNGKEIYEGDIVADESYGEDIGRLVDNVVWNNEKGAWVWEKDEVALIADSVDTIMIIGNICENPELLEENK